MLTDQQSRIGLGCMRIINEEVITAALEAGIVVFDTARAYGNEELVGRALRGRGFVVTKGGMTRPEGGWQPDGRARTIREDCEASLRALGRIDLYLLHAPDPRVPLATSVRALAQLADEKLVSHIGICNVNRRQLKEALDLAPITAVQVALGNGHDEALRGGVVSLALERGLWLMAHSPLGGVKRASRLQRDKELRAFGDPAQLMLAWLLSLHPRVIALPGASRPETARSAAAAAHLVLTSEARALLDTRFGVAKTPNTSRAEGEVVMVAGLSGAGKSTYATKLEGYERLNRDERGGTLASIAKALDKKLAQGVRRVVLDNTYLTRASRHDVIAVAARHGLAVRCLWIDISLAEAQRNVIERMLAAHGRLLEPREMRDDPTRLPPRALNNQLRQLEPPEDDEGFAIIERIAFSPRPKSGGSGRAIALSALDRNDPGEGPRLVFDWLPDGDGPLVEATRGLEVDVAACMHPAGPPVCWCRPPLPGLLLAFMHKHNLARLTVVGTTTTHRKMAEAVGADFQAARDLPMEK